jgi:hypothetical protein
MKQFFYCLMSMSLIILQSQIAFSQGKISEVKDGGLLTIIVKGYASKDLWLGCTVNPDTYNAIDLKPQKIAQGSFSIKFYLKSLSASNVMEGGIHYVVALWEEKISLKECEKRYGVGSKQCEWAKKNNYQMEGRIDRYSGEYPAN